MKQEYKKPSMRVLEINQEAIMAASDPTGAKSSGDVQLDYSGKDDDGSIDPSAKRNFNMWDE